MRSRQDIMKDKAARIASGQPVEDEPAGEAKPVEVAKPAVTELEVDLPKRRSRSSVAATKAVTELSETIGLSPAKTSEGTELVGQELERQAEADRRQKEENERTELGKQTSDLTMGPGYDRIVTHLFSLEDPMKVYEEVRESLRMGRASGASYGQLVDALDEAEEAAMRSMDLLINAKDSHDGFEIDAKIIASALRQQASDVLEDQKVKKLITKSITNDDIEAVMAANHPDEWQDLERKRGRAKRTIDLLAALHEAARERAKDLRAMVSKFRGDS